MTSPDTKPFTLDARKNLVTDTRNQAVLPGRYLQPQPAAGDKIPWKIAAPDGKASTTIEFDLDVGAPYGGWLTDKAKEPLRADIVTAVDFVQQKLPSLTVLVKEIAAFPAGIVVAADQQMDAENASKLGRIEKIGVSFYTGSIPEPKPDFDMMGRCDPEGRSSEYIVKVVLAGNTLPAGNKYWPCDTNPNCRFFIRYTHRKPNSITAATIAHELTHVWFTYKFSLFSFETGGTGHSVYSVAGTAAFFDYVPTEGARTWPDNKPYKGEPSTPQTPFWGRLAKIYAEIDAAEATQR